MFVKPRLGLKAKTTIALGVLIFSSLLAISVFSSWNSQQIAQEQVIALKQTELTLLAYEIKSLLAADRENLLSLRDVPPVQAILRAKAADGVDPLSNDSLEQWQQRLEQIFMSFVKNNQSYYQLRYIDASGNELVRVQSDSASTFVVRDLQNKMAEPYVQQTLTLPKGAFYHSNVELNREKGLIQLPHTPVLRIATPVYSEVDQRVAGLLIINIYTEQLFSHVNLLEKGVRRFISNQDGDYIRHSQIIKTFGQTLGTSFNLKKDEPVLFENLQSNNAQAYVDHNHQDQIDGYLKIFFSPEDLSRYWVLGFQMDNDIAFAPLIKERRNLLAVGALIMFITIIIILRFTSSKILAPVVNLAQVARQVQQGDINARVDETSVTDEFRTLYQTFNAFADSQVNQQQRLEQQIQLQTKKLSMVMDSLIDSLITIDDQGIVESFNPASERIFGYTAKEVIGHNVKMLMPEPYHSGHDGYLFHHLITGEKKVIGIGREVVGQRKNGQTFPMELAVSELALGGQRHFTGIVRDITERKAAEQAMTDERARLAAVINNVVDGIITINVIGNIETFNPAAIDIFGYRLDEVIGQNVKMLMPEPYHSEHDDYLATHVRTGKNKIIGTSGREVTGLRKDGTTFPMELAVSALMIGHQRHFVGIVRDITERKRIEQMQKEFISTVSHELRTPLTSIRGSLGLIVGGVTGPLTDKAKDLLNIAINNSNRLIELINDILDIEKISAGKMDFSYEIVNLIEVLPKMVDMNRGYGNQFNVRFNLDLGDHDRLMVTIDNKRIGQVVANLLSNAAKYSPRHGHVDIVVSTPTPDSVRISVSDHGEGIPVEFRRRIFGKFAQADSSDTRQKGGTGLGLSITKAIVEQHGGSIGFDTEIGKGSTFYIDLPVAENPTDTADTEVDPLPEASLPLILIVEDDIDMSNLLAMMLEKNGYQCHRAYTYPEALQQIAQHHYLAITLDLTIPDGNGIDLLRQLRSNASTHDIPVVIVSANDVDETIDSELINSVLDWIKKPIDEQRLLDVIRQGLDNKSSMLERILHIEDDLDVCKIIDSMLGEAFDVMHAYTLQQAKNLIQNQSFDLVLLDVGLPDGSGLAMLPIVAALPYELPVIIFSAEDIGQDISASVADTIMKSKTDNETLMNKITAVISKNASKPVDSL